MGRLQHNPDLLQPVFQGYKLSEAQPTQIKRKIPAPPERGVATDLQSSPLYEKFFQKHNHLFLDPWNAGTAYYVDTNHTVQAIRYTLETATLDEAVEVLPLPTVDKVDGNYNYSLHFASPDFCVMSDGVGSLSVVETGDRKKLSEWQILYKGAALNDVNCGFMVQDARLILEDNLNMFHCILSRVECKGTDIFNAVLDWVVIHLSNDPHATSISHQKRIHGKALPSYCALETQCMALMLAGEKSFRVEGAPVYGVDPLTETVSYGWTQDSEKVAVLIDVTENDMKIDFKVVCKAQRLTVLKQHRVLFNADLQDAVHPDKVNWTVENNTLKIEMIKKHKGKNPPDWSSLKSDGSLPVTEFKDENVRREFPVNAIDNIPDEDLDIVFKGRNVYFERIEATTGESTYKTNIGKCPILFTTVMQPNKMPAMGIRVEDDVCLWQFPGEVCDDFKPKHEGTLAAFHRVVSANHPNSKFVQCSPDCNYGVVADNKGYVHVYKSKPSSGGNLKSVVANQKVLMGQQYMLKLDSAEEEEICGLVADNGVIMVLTMSHVICVQIDQM